MHWSWGTGSRNADWKNFFRWAESKTQFLLYGSPVPFEMIPKRAMSQEQAVELRQILAHNIHAPR
jgi:hypothetical protein